MTTWQASAARVKFAEIFDGAIGGRPQYVQHRDGREVVVVSRAYFEQTKPNVKTFLLEGGYEGDGEAEFDKIMQGVRGSTSGLFAPRGGSIEG